MSLGRGVSRWGAQFYDSNGGVHRRYHPPRAWPETQQPPPRRQIHRPDRHPAAEPAAHRRADAGVACGSIFPRVEAIRPSPDRVRETLFNWLQPHIVGASLPGFVRRQRRAWASSALSRGASAVTFVDREPQIGRHLTLTCSVLGAAAPPSRLRMRSASGARAPSRST